MKSLFTSNIYFSQISHQQSLERKLFKCRVPHLPTATCHGALTKNASLSNITNTLRIPTSRLNFWYESLLFYILNPKFFDVSAKARLKEAACQPGTTSAIPQTGTTTQASGLFSAKRSSDVRGPGKKLPLRLRNGNHLKRKFLRVKKKKPSVSDLHDHRLAAAKLARKLSMLSIMARRMAKIYGGVYRWASKLSKSVS